MNNITKRMVFIEENFKWILLGTFGLGIVLRIINNTIYYNNFDLDESWYSLRTMYILEHNGLYNSSYLFDHPPLYMYALALPFYLFGSTWFVARGFAIFIGITTMLLFYIIGKEWKNKYFGLLLCSLYAIAPITVMINRFAYIDNLLGLFFALVIYFLLRFEHTSNSKYLYLCCLSIGLALATKITAVVLFIPLLYYFYKKNLFKTKMGWVSIFIISICLILVSYLLISNGFIEYHFRQSSVDNTEGITATLILLSKYLETLGTLLLRTGIALIPFFLGIKYVIGTSSVQKSRLKHLKNLPEKDLIAYSLIIWFIISVIFFLFFKKTGYHYDYNEFIPMIPIIGIGLYKYKKLIAPVFIILLISTAIFIPIIDEPDGNTAALRYLEEHLGENDTILATPHQEVPFYLGASRVVSIRSSGDVDLTSFNATWVVATRHHIKELDNRGANLTGYLEDYLLVFESDYDYDYGFLVYRRNEGEG